MSELPTTQKAWRVTRRGEPSDVLKLEDVPVPSKLGTGEVLVKVQAAALNPVGNKMMRWAPNFIAHRPHVAEHDFAGVIVRGNGTEFKDGDHVLGWVPVFTTFATGQGALAQYTRVSAENLVISPPNITPTEASGVALAGLTAFQALVRIANLQPGQSVFVNGGSTAVGILAIEIAKSRGCKVAASASAKNEALVRSLGADEFFDYTKGPLHETLTKAAPSPKYDVFFETVGMLDVSLYKHSREYLSPQGIFVTTGPSEAWGFGSLARFAWHTNLRPRWLGGVKSRWASVGVKAVKQDLKELSDLIAEGKVKPRVDSVHAFEDVQKAYERLLTKRATGKVVVKIAD